ncbi:MAG: hypothetical protein K0M45_00450 [Candidatus Paracaedibacteraceae bacterium]|nr:hypothetical protein [Candidatus Paracaedibacteraceae bacterium]
MILYKVALACPYLPEAVESQRSTPFTWIKRIGKIYLLSLTFLSLFALFSPGFCSPLPTTNVDPSLRLESAQGEVNRTVVMKAIAASQAKSPTIHADALRVWGKFKSGSIEPNYSYYFWARNLIIWLQKEANIKVDSAETVARVFAILQEKKMISADANSVLTRFVWGNLKLLEVLPPEERAMPHYREEQKRIFVENLNEVETQDNK